MANLKEIKERIASVQETQKITNAMFMISSNKLRLAKKMLAETEPYFFAVQEELTRIMAQLPPDTEDVYLNTYSEIAPEDRRKGYIVITDDKGLAGAYNHNVLTLAEKKLTAPGTQFFYVVGEVGRQYFRSRGIPIDSEFDYSAQKPTIPLARSIASRILMHFEMRELEEVYIIYTAMRGAMVCDARMDRLLPLAISVERARSEITEDTFRTQTRMEPSPAAVLDNIVPPCVEGYIYGALVESFCSVQNSRMLAMEAANRNALEIIKDLQRTYNRTRQTEITQQINEVVSGAKKRRA